MNYREGLQVGSMSPFTLKSIFAFIGLGNYQLSPKFSAAARTKDELSIITCYSPEDIVDRVKSKNEGDDSSENGKVI